MGVTLWESEVDPGLNEGDSVYIENFQPFPGVPSRLTAIVTKRNGVLKWDSDQSESELRVVIVVEGSEREFVERIARVFVEQHSDKYFLKQPEASS